MILLKKTFVKRVAASTIVEVLVALVIISLALMLTTQVWQTVLNDAESPMTIRAHWVLEQELARIKKEQLFYSHESVQEGLQVNCLFSDYGTQNTLTELDMYAISIEGDTLADSHVLLLKP